MDKTWITYNGEYVNSETQKTTELFGASYNDVIKILRKMKDGDALVVNATG